MANDPSPNDTDELRKRRERLEALKSKRNEAPSPTAEPAAPGGGGAAFGPFGGGGAGFAGMGGGGEGQKRQRQRKMLMKVYHVLTQTPEDEHGRVPDTPFTQSGVARLMELLRARSAAPDQPGAKVAGSLLNFIQPSEGEQATSSGASIEKLQIIARRIESLRGKGGGAGRNAAW